MLLGRIIGLWWATVVARAERAAFRARRPTDRADSDPCWMQGLDAGIDAFERLERRGR